MTDGSTSHERAHGPPLGPVISVARTPGRKLALLEEPLATVETARRLRVMADHTVLRQPLAQLP
ncbi:hypothetical protein Scani_18780 [Streptomyces caniferus]|uniref:Uncharacterized protein n=1 Tax=Streptomyces caniferus TaxID=285557 RepID=A0A640S378_9ACTN|nr:hypothetical protein Scani_18780 [Streptomyces caniferus]